MSPRAQLIRPTTQSVSTTKLVFPSTRRSTLSRQYYPHGPVGRKHNALMAVAVVSLSVFPSFGLSVACLAGPKSKMEGCMKLKLGRR